MNYVRLIYRHVVCWLLGHDWMAPDFHLCARCGFAEDEAKELLDFAIEQVTGGCETIQHDEP